MKIIDFECWNVRNHVHSSLECAEGLNVIVGLNGEGKTTLLETLALATLTRSFVVANDRALVREGSDGWRVRASLESDLTIRSRIEITYKHGTGKELSVNGDAMPTLISHIGSYPTVTLSPDQKIITDGAPAERRTFLDLVLSQSSRTYLEDLAEYRRVVKQRNKILLDARMDRRGWNAIRDILFPWTERLVSLGARITFRRVQFLSEFKNYITSSYERLAPSSEKLAMEYVVKTSGGHDTPAAEVAANEGEYTQWLHTELEKISNDELRRGTTLLGPHHDDLAFRLYDMPVRSHASQGQHKTMLIALKLAECSYLRDVTREAPVVLFDDILSELDAERRAKLFSILEDFGQAFLTTTDEKHFSDATGPRNARNRVFCAEKGTVNRID